MCGVQLHRSQLHEKQFANSKKRIKNLIVRLTYHTTHILLYLESEIKKSHFCTVQAILMLS